MAPLRVESSSRLRLAGVFGSVSKAGVKKKKNGVKLLEEGMQLISEYQARPAAQDTWGVLEVLQALDAAGKDGTIRHVMSDVNPQAVSVHGLLRGGARSRLSLSVLRRLPARGEIGIFNA